MKPKRANRPTVQADVRFQVGEYVSMRVTHTRNSYRDYYLKDARVESVSSCGRYLRVSGVRPWGHVRHTFDVPAGHVRKSNAGAHTRSEAE